MFRNQLASLFLHERIQTTIDKARELRPLAEKMVTLARRTGTGPEKLHARRIAESRILQPTATKRLFDVIAPRFQTRPGGYTRILKLGKMRKGDNAELAILEFVDYVFEPKTKKAPAQKGAKKEDAEASEAKPEKAKKEKASKPAKTEKAGEKKDEKKTTAPKPKKAEKSESKPKVSKDKKK